MFRNITSNCRIIIFGSSNSLILRQYTEAKRIIPSKMLFIRNEREKKVIELTLRYPISPNNEREFNLNRNFDEKIGKTFEKLTSNLVKHLSVQQKKKVKKLKSGKNSPPLKVEIEEDELNITVELFDTNNEQISNETLNEHAWKEGYKVKINEKYFQVVVDLPSLKKISLPKQLIANMPVFIISDKEDNLFIDKCKFKWYISSNEFDKNEWELLNEGVNNRMIYLNSNTENKYIKVVCTPNDGTRDGLIVEIISKKTIENLFQLYELPMTDRHKLTTEKLTGNEYDFDFFVKFTLYQLIMLSFSLRVISYNILAKCYADTATAKNSFYPYCSLEHLNHLYT